MSFVEEIMQEIAFRSIPKITTSKGDMMFHDEGLMKKKNSMKVF